MSAADRQLLLGTLALHSSLVSQDSLQKSFRTWVTDKSRDLGELLLEQGTLNRKQLILLANLVAESIQQQGSAEKCLHELGTLSAIRQELAELADPDLEQSLQHLPASPAHSKLSATTIAPGSEANPVPLLKTAGALSATGGRFQVIRHHAQGGLGVVSVAHDGELNREVALKEIKAAYAHDGESRSRFLLEAEVTGGLEHPGIVPVYGLGQYDDGRPYYAMRFIQGDSLKEAVAEFHSPWTEWTESARNLRLRRLLQQFIDVCEAIHYAHARGVLHRDLKPANIMLGKYGETLVVDWGLARTATSGPATAPAASSSGERALRPRLGSSVTQIGQAVGTPQYMSPEQALGQLDQLGPATDIYSLGATLYTIVTGQPPIVGQTVQEVLTKVRQGRIVPPRQINPRIPRALEAITLRALALQPDHRYATAQALADDVEHWLADEAVEAYHEPLVARVRRGLRKRPMVTGSLLATLLVGLVALGIGSVVVGQKNFELSQSNASLVVARRAALNQKTQAERNAKVAEAERDRVRKAMEFLVAAFRKPDPEQNGREIKAADLLLSAAEEARVTLADEPLMQSEILMAIRQTVHGLGLFVEALPLAQEAARIRERILGLDDPATLSANEELATALEAVGEIEQSVLLYEKTYRRTATALGAEHPKTLTAMGNLATAYQAAEQLDKAIPLLAESLRLKRIHLPLGDPEILTSIGNLAGAYSQARQFDKAIPLLEEVLPKLQQQLGRSHPHTLASLGNLANSYATVGKLDQALLLHQEGLQLKSERLGADHPDTLKAMFALGMAYDLARQPDKSIPLYEETLQKMQERLGADHDDTLGTMNNLAGAYFNRGQIAKALPLSEEILRLRRVKQGESHPATLKALNNLALAYKSARQFDKAVPLYRAAVDQTESARGPDHAETLVSQNNVATALQAAGQTEEALAWIEKLHEQRLAILGSTHQQTVLTTAWLVDLHLKSPEPKNAIPFVREFISAIRQMLPPDSSERAAMLASSGFHLLNAELWSEAEEVLRESLSVREQRQSEQWTTFETRAMVGAALAGRGKAILESDHSAAEKLFAAAEPLLTTGVQGMLERRASVGPASHKLIVRAGERLIEMFTVWQKPEQAAKWRAEMKNLQ